LILVDITESSGDLLEKPMQKLYRLKWHNTRARSSKRGPQLGRKTNPSISRR